MQKAEARRGQAQQQTLTRHNGAAQAESPQHEHIAQLEAMAEGSPQVERQRNLAATINTSPLISAQRKIIEGIHSSPTMLAQHKQFDSLFGTVQREGDATPRQGKLKTIQRTGNEELLQGKAASCPPAQLEQQATPKPNNTGLPDKLKSGIENISGMSMDNVKVHFNSSQPAQLNALAYAQGSDIHVAPGQEQHLPHEAWHVVQQAQGRVKPTIQMKDGVPVNDDAGLEHEADAMGILALSEQDTESFTTPKQKPDGVPNNPVQRVITDDAGKIITEHDLDNLDYYSAEFLYQQIEVLRVWRASLEDLEKINGVRLIGPPVYSGKSKSKPGTSGKSFARKDDSTDEKKFVPKTLSEKEIEIKIQPYLDLIDHLAGEGGGTTELKGGHLLSAMKTKYKNLLISGEPKDDGSWEGWWTDGTASPKWSSFFPANWTIAKIKEELRGSSTKLGGRELKCGIAVTKQGETFFPWVNQTLKVAPKISGMKKP